MIHQLKLTLYISSSRKKKKLNSNNIVRSIFNHCPCINGKCSLALAKNTLQGQDMSASSTKIKFTYLVAWTMTTDEMICILMTFIKTIGSYCLKLGLHPHLDLVQEELHSKINFCFLEATQSKTVSTMMISFRTIC